MINVFRTYRVGDTSTDNNNCTALSTSSVLPLTPDIGDATLNYTSDYLRIPRMKFV